MKILFLGFNHYSNDPRLFYRQMQVIYNHNPKTRFLFLTYDREENEVDYTPNLHRIKMPLHIIHLRRNVILKILNLIFRHLRNYYYSIKVCRKLKPDWIQASDVRELLIGVCCQITSGTKLIYDSHEDYVHQLIEYNNKFSSYFKAFLYSTIEHFFLRFPQAVFCTDEYQYKRMAKKVFGVKHLFLLRNFPIASKTCRKTDFLTSKTLKLVYVGSINKFRGILETVEYVQEFNNKYHSKKHLTLSIFSRPSDLLTPYINFSDIIQEKYLNYPELMKALRSYDVGICLWLPLKKFHRNLPIKNFDYMAAGLPVITSNFGNLKKYIDLSGAGIAIDPNSYEEFENAINMMFDHNNRKLFSDNGRLYIENEGNFEKESVPYVRMYSNSEKY